MAKKITLAVLFFALIFSTNAFAAAPQTTDSSKNPQSTFSWDETPYLYFTLTSGASALESWTSPTNVAWTPTIPDNGVGKDLDTTLGSILNALPQWSTRREVGTWTWSISANGATAPLSGSFTVTPEPISYALFLIGGVALAVKQYRKKKDA